MRVLGYGAGIQQRKGVKQTQRGDPADSRHTAQENEQTGGGTKGQRSYLAARPQLPRLASSGAVFVLFFFLFSPSFLFSFFVRKQKEGVLRARLPCSSARRCCSRLTDRGSIPAGSCLCSLTVFVCPSPVLSLSRSCSRARRLLPLVHTPAPDERASRPFLPPNQSRSVESILPAATFGCLVGCCHSVLGERT